MPKLMNLKGFFRKIILPLSVFTLFITSASAQHGVDEGNAREQGFDVKEAIFHHLYDAYQFDFWKKNDSQFVTLELPRILYNSQSGKLDFFGGTHAAEEAGYLDFHHYNHDAVHGTLLVPEAKPIVEEMEAKLASASPEEKKAIHNEYVSKLGAYAPYDFSLTKNVILIFIVTILMLVIFLNIAGAYKKREGMAPKGSQSFFEPIIEFIRDEIAKPNLHGSYERFMPLLLTLFFFIWFLNMLGMVPFSGNITGNIAVTLTLSLVTFVVILFAANKGYWKHIFWPPVPHAVKPILIPVEIIGIFTKPFALTIRLFANMTAGHVMMISLLSLIFLFGKMGQEAGMAWGTGVFSTLFLIFISLLELFVAALQAYVFTMLSAVFIGQAIENHDHHQEDVI